MHCKTGTVFAAFTLLGLAGSGCIISSHDDGGRQGFTMSWVVQTSTGDPSTCDEMAAATVQLIVQNVSSAAVYNERFPCSAGAGTTEALPQGQYALTAQLLDSANNVLSELKLDQTQPLGRNVTAPLGQIQFQAYFPGLFLTWNVRKLTAGNPVPITCAQAGAATVELVTTQGSDQKVYDFHCTDMAGLTTTVAPGTYNATASLLDAGNRILSMTSAMSFTVGATGRLDLGEVTFDVN